MLADDLLEEFLCWLYQRGVQFLDFNLLYDEKNKKLKLRLINLPDNIPKRYSELIFVADKGNIRLGKTPEETNWRLVDATTLDKSEVRPIPPN